MKILCVCEAGIVRSVALAIFLRENFHGIETLAVGTSHHSLDTIHLLMQWADLIFVVDRSILNGMPTLAQNPRVRVIPIGPDLWGSPDHRSLHEKIESLRDSHIALEIDDFKKMSKEA